MSDIGWLLVCFFSKKIKLNIEIGHGLLAVVMSFIFFTFVIFVTCHSHCCVRVSPDLNKTWPDQISWLNVDIDVMSREKWHVWQEWRVIRNQLDLSSAWNKFYYDSNHLNWMRYKPTPTSNAAIGAWNQIFWILIFNQWIGMHDYSIISWHR